MVCRYMASGFCFKQPNMPYCFSPTNFNCQYGYSEAKDILRTEKEKRLY